MTAADVPAAAAAPTNAPPVPPESIPLPESPHLIAIDDDASHAASLVSPRSPTATGTQSRTVGGDNLGTHLTKQYALHKPELSSLPVWLNQFLVLTKRNLLLIVRYKKATLAQAVFAPVLFTTLLLLLQTLYVQRQRRERLYPTATTLDGVRLCQGVVESAPCVTVMYTPDTPATRLIMRTFSEKNKERTGQALELAPTALTDNSRPQTKVGIVAVPNPDFIYNYVLTNPNTTQFGVAFQATLPTARYQLWYNTTQAANGSDIYAGELLSMQRGLDEAILAVATTENAISQPDSFTVAGGLDTGRLDVLVKDWPTVGPETVPDTIVSNMGAMFFFCSVMVVFIAILQDVVTEKELMLRHAMATMGLRASVYWVSTFLSRALLVLLASLVTVVTGIACQFSAFTQSSFLVMLAIFFAFGLAMVSFGFFITTFCRRARVAVLVGMFIFIIGLLFQSFAFSSAFVGYVWWDSSTPTYWQYIFNCIPFFSFGKLFLDVSVMTAGRFDFLTQTSVAGPGFPLSALWNPIPKDQLPTYDGRVPNVPYPITTLWILALNSVVYFMLAWYFDKVIPDEYGSRQSIVFFLTPRYWGFNKSVAQALQDFVNRTMPLGDRPDFRVMGEDDDVAEERKRVFDKDIDAAVRIGNLRKVYRNNMFFASKTDKVAVRSLCLTLGQGELLALLGQNGAGKSTTMAMLSGLTPPTAGDAIIFGKSVTEDMEAIRANMGICPQHDILFNDLTPVEHIELYGGIKHLSKAEIEKVCKERLEAVRLWKVKDQRVGTFSGGMKRRMSVLISTIGDPDVLFLDEPTTGMDPVNRRHVWAFLEAFKKNRIVVLTTHAMEEADALGDRIAVMALGRLRALGPNIHLKNKFGLGYRIGMTAKLGSTARAKALVAACVPEAVLEDDAAGALMYRVPQSFTAKVPEFVKMVESHEGQQVVESWGLSQTTLEEVFLRLIRQAVAEAAE